MICIRLVHNLPINTIPTLYTKLNLPYSQRTIQETKGWDVFRDPPIKIETGSTANQECLELTIKILKIFAYIFTFIVVLTGGVIAKGTVLFMTSQVRKDRKIEYCNKDLVSHTITSILYIK